MANKTLFDHYYVYQELTDMLEKLSNSYPGYMNYYSLGKTEKGRDVWAVEITNTKTGDFSSKPAYYIDGNHHAGEVTGSMASLNAIDSLLTGSEDNEQIKYLLDNYTFYIIPRVSPDGAEVYLTTPEHLRSVDRPYPYCDVEPGLQAKDMNGDGIIAQMRVPSPQGAWKVSELDSRLMVKRSPDEKGGQYYHVFQEGYIVDYDGLDIKVGENKWGRDFNRNYPNCWFPEYRQPGAGNYPLENPENKMVADFIINHPNIGSAVTNHTSGGVFVYPPGTKPEKEAAQRDISMFKAIGKMATEETGYVCVNIYDEFLKDAVNFSSGALDDWMYGHRGIPAYTSELWNLAIRSGVENVWPRKEKDQETEENDYLKMIKWVDENLDGKGYLPYEPFNHPQLGLVDIGGFDIKFVYQNCPPAYLQQELDKVTNFYLRHAMCLPKVEVKKAEAIKVDSETWHLTLELVNDGYLPTFLTQEGLNVKVDKTIKVFLSLPNEAELVYGDKSKDIGHLEGRAGIKSGYFFGNIRTSTSQAMTKRIEWVVKGKPNQAVTVEVNSPTGGKFSVDFSLE